jgi:hypothetical protein
MVYNLVTGDSHSRHVQVFNGRNFLCSAGSAKGLNNPHSVSQYGRKLLEHVRSHNNEISRIIFLFGGVDCDFSYVHKLIHGQMTNYVEFNREVIENYVHYVVSNFSDKEVVFLSVGLPTLDDHHLREGILNAHVTHLEAYKLDQLRHQIYQFPQLPCIQDRTAVTLNFNAQLKEKIESLGNPRVKFIDVTSFTLDENRGYIKEQFFTKRDHHNRARVGEMINIINRHIAPVSQPKPPQPKPQKKAQPKPPQPKPPQPKPQPKPPQQNSAQRKKK